MITIDGSLGEGGGQILRSALTLSLATGTPFRIERIRAGRAKPGLLRQHLTAVRAAAAIGRATVTGAELGSTALGFAPGPVVAGDYDFAIGSAGATLLVLQTVLLPLALASAPSRLRLQGGTHAMGAPSFDFAERAFLPLLHRMGFHARAALRRHGFHPAGGGVIEVEVMPRGKPAPLVLERRGALLSRQVEAVVTHLPLHIAARETAAFAKALRWRDDTVVPGRAVAADGPGNCLTVTVAHEHATEVFTGHGQPGLPAEDIAAATAKAVRLFLASRAPVGPHLADQLLLPMALGAGGRFVTVAPTPHTLTNIAVIEAFLGPRIAVTRHTGRSVLVKVAGRQSKETA
ncbi:RNA 3'-terminal phosphate cyclase [Inquilinus sp. Marseille-Q2685]|uniref:RNA 3'-terminal phosphate cyclase n=1 Tax=Inquilinus sp. Marseille-Q2685 TaxID=2866581 RepID=UPI001CE4259C|nr:RNA 3'-terminal phosphate cyclase [Inquilinus sp. Marseille-Q2685]